MLVYAHQKHSAFKRCLRRAAPTPTKFLEDAWRSLLLNLPTVLSQHACKVV
ncbi:MAG: hypothetical protein ACYTX0_35600 [Nostoc sp.]